MSVIFGAKGKIFLKYNGELEDLSQKISKGLIVNNFVVEHKQDPPYDLTGWCEALGFQLWLNKTELINGYNYVFEMETSLSEVELFHDQMYDLSLWIGRYISIICDLDTCIIDANNNLTVFNSNKQDNIHNYDNTIHKNKSHNN